jgi:hypothetical protein
MLGLLLGTLCWAATTPFVLTSSIYSARQVVIHPVSVSNCRFMNCRAMNDGGGLLVNHTLSVHLDHSHFDSCSTDAAHSGGAAFLASRTIDVAFCTAAECASGRGLFLFLDGPTSVGSSAMVDSASTRGPGGIFAAGYISVIDFNATRDIAADGSSIYFDSAEDSRSLCRLVRATRQRGNSGMWIGRREFVIEQSIFTDNSFGSAVLIGVGRCEARDCCFLRNSAPAFGGPGIFSETNSLADDQVWDDGASESYNNQILYDSQVLIVSDTIHKSMRSESPTVSDGWWGLELWTLIVIAGGVAVVIVVVIVVLCCCCCRRRDGDGSEGAGGEEKKKKEKKKKKGESSSSPREDQELASLFMSQATSASFLHQDALQIQTAETSGLYMEPQTVARTEDPEDELNW